MPAPASRLKSPNRARSRRQVAPGRSPVSYRQVRATIALLLFMLLFALLWMANGELTARFVMATTGRSATVGWSIHLLITMIEIAPAILAPYTRAMPRRLVLVLWCLSLPFGIFDVLSSAVGIAPFLAFLPTAGGWVYLQNTIAAQIIGFLPEQMILWLIVALRSVLKGD